MALRFRKSVKLMPGLRINLSTKGASLTMGPRGSSFNLGKRGLRYTASLPGTGISYQTTLIGPSKGKKAPSAAAPKPQKAVAPLAAPKRAAEAAPAVIVTQAMLQPSSRAATSLAVTLCIAALVLTYVLIG